MTSKPNRPSRLRRATPLSGRLLAVLAKRWAVLTSTCPFDRRRQVNYVESSKFGDLEAEYLFAPYSVFTVLAVQPSAPNSYINPHVITLEPAVDNLLEPKDLPLAPWY